MAVGLIVGGWFASTVISKLINELIEYAKDQKKMQLGLKDELARLQKALPKIQAVVNAVDQGLIREENPALEKWLWQLRDAADQADDVMDEIKYDHEKERALKTEKNKVDKAITNFKTFFLRAVKADPFLKRLKKAVKAIDEVAAGVVEFYMIVQSLNKDRKEMVKSAISNRKTSSVLNVRTCVFGREKEKEDIINKLLNPVCKTEGNFFAVLPIIGIGGVGKTTLAQLVYNDPIVIEHFKLRMWVCISNNFDVELLTKKLYESAFETKADFESFDLIQTKLIKKLMSQRFLVVFDDVWNETDKLGWEKLIAPLKNGKSGSMILLTTRSKKVAPLVGPNVVDSIILKGLNKDDMWDLFKESAFGGEDPNDHKELVEIGRNIVKKLKGFPLAAKTVGGILCSDLSEIHWKNILESELCSLEQTHNDIIPALRLTYQYLSPYLKPCFSFCSIFPKHHIFRKDDLINMWIALGMVHPSVNSTIRLEDVGSKNFDEMVSKSIFENVFGKDEFVMHDLLHDLSIFVSKGECFRTSSKEIESTPNTVRHLYVHDIDSSCGRSISGLRNLRALILNFNSHQPDSLVTEMLKGMEKLRLLVLFANNLSEIPECVNKLLHLRYLNIRSSRINAVPKSVSRLYLLETMVCNGIDTDQLKHGNTNRRLTSLKEFSFNVGNDGFKICWLVEPVNYLPPGGFNKFISLKGLEIIACPKRVVQEECFLPSALQRLSISSCGHLETFFPKAFENVQSLVELILYGCPNITSLPPKEVFSRWKTLKKLTFEHCPVLASLESLLGLSSIEHLTITDCPKLSREISRSLPLENDETKTKEDGTMQTSDRYDEFNNWFSACSRKTNELKRLISTQPQLPSPSTQEKPLIFVDEIDIDDPLLLSIEPIRSLFAVNILTINDCSKLQSLPALPELPAILKVLYMHHCYPELLKLYGFRRRHPGCPGKTRCCIQYCIHSSSIKILFAEIHGLLMKS